jgi:hypothetical protein
MNFVEADGEARCRSPMVVSTGEEFFERTVEGFPPQGHLL